MILGSPVEVFKQVSRRVIWGVNAGSPAASQCSTSASEALTSLLAILLDRGHQQHGKRLIFVRDLSLLFPRLSDTYYHIWKPDFYLFT